MIHHTPLTAFTRAFCRSRVENLLKGPALNYLLPLCNIPLNSIFKLNLIRKDLLCNIFFKSKAEMLCCQIDCQNFFFWYQQSLLLVIKCDEKRMSISDDKGFIGHDSRSSNPEVTKKTKLSVQLKVSTCELHKNKSFKCKILKQTC